MKLPELPRCCILQLHSKDAKGGLPSRRESNIYGWSTKRSRYSNLIVLGAEAFDVASNNHEEFDKVKNYLGASYQKSINLTMVELIARNQTIKHITLLWVLFLIH